jgi:hypothetical protein
MDEGGVKLIQDSAKAEHHEVTIDDVLFSNKHLEPIYFDPRPATLDVSTLTALVDYIKMDTETADEAIMLHVESPVSVAIVGMEEGVSRKRTTWMRAEVDGNAFEFDTPMDPESFNIALQSLFKDAEDRADVLQLAGTITSTSADVSASDGVTQTVETRRTVSGALVNKDIKIVNPVMLRPWRTFREVEQPASLFVFRIHDGPKCALYEADGSAWKLEAIQNVKAWLAEKLPDVSIIA